MANNRIKKRLDLIKEVGALPGRLVRAQNEHIQATSDTLNRKTTDRNRPIGTRLDGRIWAGQSYGWQSEATYQKLLTSGEFRRGEQTMRRLGNDVSNAASQAWSDLPNDVRAGVKQAGRVVKSALWDKQPKAVRDAVVGGLRGAEAINEEISKRTNISRQITGEVGAEVLTAGAARLIKGGRIASRLAAKADDIPLTRQASGAGIRRNVQRQLDANDLVRRRNEAGAVGFGSRPGKGEAEPIHQKIPSKYRKFGEIDRGSNTTAAELNIGRRIRDNVDRLRGTAPKPDAPKTAGRTIDLSRRAEVSTDQWNRTRISGDRTDVILRQNKDITPDFQQLIKDPDLFNRSKRISTEAMADAIANANDSTTFSRAREATRRLAASTGHHKDTLKSGAKITPGVRPKSTKKLTSNAIQEGETTDRYRIRSAQARRRADEAAAGLNRAQAKSDVPYKPSQAPDGGFASSPSGTGMVRFTDVADVKGKAKRNALQREWNEEWAGKGIERDSNGLREGLTTNSEAKMAGLRYTLQEISGDTLPPPDMLSRSALELFRERARLNDRTSRAMRRRLHNFDNISDDLDESARMSRIRRNLSARAQVIEDAKRQGKLQGYLDRGEDMGFDGVYPDSPRYNEDVVIGKAKGDHPHRDRSYRLPLHGGRTGNEEFLDMLPDAKSKHLYDTNSRLFYFDVDDTSLAPAGFEGTTFIPQKVGDSPYYTSPNGINRPKFTMNPLATDIPEHITRRLEVAENEAKTMIGRLKEAQKEIIADSGWVFKADSTLDYEASLQKALANKTTRRKLEGITRNLDEVEGIFRELHERIAARFEIIKAGDPIPSKSKARAAQSTQQALANQTAAAEDSMKRVRKDGTLQSKTLPGRDPLTRSEIEDLITIHLGEVSQGDGVRIVGTNAQPTSETGRVLQAYNALSDDKKELLAAVVKKQPIENNADALAAIRSVGGYADNPDAAIHWSDRISERSAKYGGATGNDARRLQNTLDDKVSIPGTPIKGSALTKKEQELYNKLVSGDLLSDDLVPRNNTHIGKASGRAKFAADMEEAGRIKDRLIGRRNRKGASGRRADKMTYEDGLHFYGDQTRENYDIGRNRSIDDRARTLRYEQEFADRFPEEYAQGRAAYIRAFEDAYGMNSEEARLAVDKLMRTDNDAGRQSIAKVFRDARERRGSFDTRDRGVRNRDLVRPGKPKKDPLAGHRDNIGRYVETPTPLDDYVARINKLMADEMPSRMYYDIEQGKYVFEPDARKFTADDVAPVQGARRAVPPTNRADRKPGSYKGTPRTVGDRSIPAHPISTAKPEPVRRGGRIRQRVLDRGYPTPTELRKQKRIQSFVERRRKQRAAKGIASRYGD